MAEPTVRESLHRLVELVPDEDLKTLARMMRGLVREDPVATAIRNAPEDDEPVSEEEAEAVARGRAQAARGEMISDAELWHRLGHES